MARAKYSAPSAQSSATIGFEAKLWLTADKLRNNMDAAEYKHVVLGLIFRIQTEDVAKALKIFETINDRGVGLDSMDLLKNLLFMKSGQDEFEALKKIWKELQDTIFEAGEKPLRFLRYFKRASPSRRTAAWTSEALIPSSWPNSA